MSGNTLPRQIVVLVTAVLLAVMAVLWLSLLSVRTTMDKSAAEESARRVAGRLRNMQEQVALLASDYHNWTDLYLAARDRELDRLASNYGISAHRGEVFQYAEIFDGPFAAPLSWRAGAGLTPQSGFLSEPTRAALRKIAPGLDPKRRQSHDFFELRDGQPVMFSGSYLLPEDPDLLAGVVPGSAPIAAIGKILQPERLQDMEREFAIAGLEVTTVAPQTDIRAALPGVDGTPVAWLRWTPPQPGTQLFWKMFPIMAGISGLFVVISWSAAMLLRSKAAGLIEREAISFDRARIDALTGLPNRFAMREHLGRLRTRPDVDCAVLVIDLVRFKLINDTVGHLGGDAFLVEFGARLRTIADDAAFVARYGGDEFFVVFSASADLDRIVEEKCRQISALSEVPIQCGGVSFEVLSSKGLVFEDHRGMDHDELLRRADRAMYSAKLRETLEVVRYDKRMETEDIDHKRVERELRRALGAGEGFAIHYQPIVPVTPGARPVRYEALARWTSPELGPVAPDRFIKVAEASGLIMPLGWLLLDLICADMRQLQGVGVGINVSPAQLMSRGFAKRFHQVVVSHGIAPERIVVEVTEQVVMRDDATIAQELIALSDSGFRLALDDFGTGFASIGYLTRMPFDELKIDRSFVRSIEEGQQGMRMVKSIIGLARAMELDIVAEGIETETDAVLLRRSGADFLQGYHFGRPAPVTAWIGTGDPGRDPKGV